MKNKGKKLLSRIVAACFALLLTVSMAIPAHAAIDPKKTYTITVNGKATDDGATVDVYKIIEVNYDYDVQQPKAPAYRWVEPIASWLKAQEELKEYIGENNEVDKSFAELTGLGLSNVMKDIETAIQEKTITFSDKYKEDNYKSAIIKGDSVEISNMKMGQYLILTTANQESAYKDYTYVPVTANITPVYNEEEKGWSTSDASVTIKGSPASIEKEVEDPTVAIGQKVEYTVNVPVPYYPEDAVAKLFRIGDQLPIGITFGATYEDNNLTVNAVYENGDKLKIGTSDSQKAQCFTYYYQAKDCGKDGVFPQSDKKEGRNATFILDFNYDALMDKYATHEKEENTFALKSIEVTYTGTINENAILKPGDPEYPGEDPLENKAYVGQNNDPYDWGTYKPTEDKEKVYTYAINILKVAEDGMEQLAGAEFQLSGEAVMKFVKLADGEYRLAKADDTNTTTKLVVGENKGNIGKLKLEGLTTGTYHLQETKAPDGYEVLDEVIEIQIIDENKDGVVDNPGDVDNDPKTNIVYRTVRNRKPPIMPITGGMGTVIFSVVGIVLVVGGVTLIASYLRRKRA